MQVNHILFNSNAHSSILELCRMDIGRCLVIQGVRTTVAIWKIRNFLPLGKNKILWGLKAARDIRWS